MLNRATALLNFADADAQFQRRYCSISPAEALNFNAVCTCVGIILFYRVRLRAFCLRDTGRIYAFQVLLLFRSLFSP
jgi:hypothetical protein